MVTGKRPKYQTWNALSAMMFWHNGLQSRIKITSHKFSLLEAEIATQKSIKFLGENNVMYGKRHSAETKAKMTLR